MWFTMSMFGHKDDGTFPNIVTELFLSLMKWDKKEVPRDYPKLSSKSSEMRAFGSTLGVIQLFSRL